MPINNVKMPNLRYCFLALVLLLSPVCALAESAPENVKHAMLLTPSDKAVARAETIDGNLIDDNVFISNLRIILTDSSLSPNDKLDAFILMLRKINWAFNGSVQLPPGFDYLNFFTGQAGTFYKYSKALDISLDPNPYEDIARNLRIKQPVKAGHAMLLAAIISPTLAEPTIKSFLASYQNDSPLFFHPLVMASALTDSTEVSKELVDLLDKVMGEECLEDIICALSLLGIEYSQKGLFQFVQTKTQKPFDLETETALLAIKSHMKDEIFANFYSTLLSKVSDQTAIKHLVDFKEGNFRYSLMNGTTGAIKVWDNVSIVVYDNGYLIKAYDLQDFVAK